MSDGRARRQLALGAVRLFLLITVSLLPAAVAQAQDLTEPAALTLELQGGVVTSDTGTYSEVDDLIAYDYRLTNTGGVTLDVVSVIDTILGEVTCGGPLEPGGSVDCTGYHPITQADLDAGSVTNRAQGFGTYGDSGEVASNEASLTISAAVTEPAALTLELQADVLSDTGTYSEVDDLIAYDYRLTNTGGVTLDVVSVIDTILGEVTCGGPLEPGGSVDCTGYHPITQADLDAGSVTNRAQGFGTYGDSGEVASNEASLTISAAVTEPAP